MSITIQTDVPDRETVARALYRGNWDDDEAFESNSTYWYQQADRMIELMTGRVALRDHLIEIARESDMFLGVEDGSNPEYVRGVAEFIANLTLLYDEDGIGGATEEITPRLLAPRDHHVPVPLDTQPYLNTESGVRMSEDDLDRLPRSFDQYVWEPRAGFERNQLRYPGSSVLPILDEEPYLVEESGRRFSYADMRALGSQEPAPMDYELATWRPRPGFEQDRAVYQRLLTV